MNPKDDPLRRLFEGLAARRAPGILYHYTSGPALIGICESRAFWGTNIRYLNDSKEYDLALEMLSVMLDEKVDVAESRYEKALYPVLRDGLTRAQSSEVFVVSFSEEGDQLGQWRAYCPAGAGYAIGIAPAQLRRAHGDPSKLSLLRCLYDFGEQQALLARLVGLAEDYIVTAKVSTNPDPDRVYREAFKLFSSWLPVAAAVIKHEAFAEEREWRLLAQESFFDGSAPLVRSGTSTLIPYQPFVLATTRQPLELQEVIVGPTPHPRLAIEGVHTLCRRHRMRNVVIDASEVPYRTW